MADISSILGGAWSPPQAPILASPEEQLREAIRSAGLIPPDDIYLDGKLHRFRSGSKGNAGHGDKTGWYVCYGDGIPAGRFGDWRTGEEISFRADIGRKFTPAEEMINALRLNEARAQRDAELAKQREAAANIVETIWSGCVGANPNHPYLIRKGIKAHGARVTGDGRLVVPLYDSDGVLCSLQYIDADGGKLYHSGGSTGGKFWMLGVMDEPGCLYMAEGFATAATIHEETDRPCIVAYSASNLPDVLGEIRQLYGQEQEVIIVADNDKSGTGQKYADQASAKHGAKVVIPPIPGDANDYKKGGHDLLQLLNPTENDWLIPADEFCAQPAPISWLIKHWLQDNALIMVHGPSGGGKTFVVLDWCLHISTNLHTWANNKVKTKGSVVYLAGEGHHGLRGRVAAWKQHHQAKSINMWLSKDGCDLNTPEGYMRVASNLRNLNENPSLIVVDTLHRFLLGDENSAQDTKTMLDACNTLMREFNCSVLLVHHTGVADEAQHRARGSSAWRGALDIEISVVPSKDGMPMQIIQRKSKDSELSHPIYCELKSIPINNWIDEDGEQVSSAIINIVDSPIIEEKKESAHHSLKKRFERGWLFAGAEFIQDAPYVSRSAMVDFLSTNDGLSHSSAELYCKPSNDKFIGALINSDLIKIAQNGWIVTDSEWSSVLSLMVAK